MSRTFKNTPRVNVKPPDSQNGIAKKKGIFHLIIISDHEIIPNIPHLMDGVCNR